MPPVDGHVVDGVLLLRGDRRGVRDKFDGPGGGQFSYAQRYRGTCHIFPIDKGESSNSCANSNRELLISIPSQMSPKKWSKNTFGWARAEVLGALVNAVFLVAICFSITIEACKRFIEMEPIHEPKLLVIVGVIGLLINVVGLVLLFGKCSSKFPPFSLNFF